ncbi:hypothetical protein [Glutamicibacter sp. ZJUTW]|nr:hypothetical protein [Glutamicibacter sp. ZJUTW]QEP06375.1 hypothetical protein F0M17_03510 [Glutamicibacter sp. ZJUTW]
MARRVLTIHELTFREKGKREGAGRVFAPVDLLGDDLLDIFSNWLSKLTREDTVDKSKNTWVNVTAASRYASRIIVVETSVGSSGESGEVVDSETGESEFQLAAHHAPTGTTRTLLLVPEKGRSAFLMTESSRRGSGGIRLRQLFSEHITDLLRLIKMDCSAVSESDAWAEHAKLKEVELRVEGKSVDAADGVHVDVGVISHIARPHRRAFFNRDLLGKLATDKSTAKRVVGIPVDEEHEKEDVYVTLVDGERQKKFLVEGGGAPSFRLVLNEDSAEQLNTDDLVAKCVEQLSDITGITGKINWEPRWSDSLGAKHGKAVPLANSQKSFQNP